MLMQMKARLKKETYNKDTTNQQLQTINTKQQTQQDAGAGEAPGKGHVT